MDLHRGLADQRRISEITWVCLSVYPAKITFAPPLAQCNARRQAPTSPRCACTPVMETTGVTLAATYRGECPWQQVEPTPREMPRACATRTRLPLAVQPSPNETW